MSAKVADLAFKARRGLPDLMQAQVAFPNGYTASVIQGPMAFFNWRPGLYELAVLGPDGELDYDTPITNDVERGDAAEINELLARIAALPAKATTP